MVLGVSPCQYREVPSSISFSGSGFLATYQLGVAQCLQSQAPWILQSAPCVLGASAGSLVAAAVVCQMSLPMIRDEMLNFAREMKAFTFGPLNPSINIFHWLEKILVQHLPHDAHQLASGRLVVGLTRMTDGEHVQVSDYRSKEDVIQALLCSCYVPGYCGLQPPSFRGEHYVDGGFTNMQPVLSRPCSQTLTVAPFSGEADICPDDSPCVLNMVVTGTMLKANLANSARIFNALYPLALETLEEAFCSGYKDALEFLVNHELIAFPTMNHIAHDNLYAQAPLILETMVGEEEEMAAGTKTTSPSETERNGNVSAFYKSHKLVSISVEILESVLLLNLLPYLRMLGSPAVALSYLLVPVILPVFLLLHGRRWLDSELAQWTWLSLKHFIWFFTNVCISTVKRNLRDRLGLVLLLVKLLHFEKELEKASQEMPAVSSSRPVPASSHSEDLHRSSLDPQRAKKKPGLRIM
ncbi:patatin-like phospholipase domain-containing protein 2 [Synchiropus splendidus]|uniref:patatin-like phospholipase domain-containing protein 2 n=1 Tax=Synchiropus splendidus TaxID=270530 RepID=UPI00237E73B7|nr:patatin-like phospholipase domain-containing protein 2 [Synchiropus splendidus]